MWFIAGFFHPFSPCPDCLPKSHALCLTHLLSSPSYKTCSTHFSSEEKPGLYHFPAPTQRHILSFTSESPALIPVASVSPNSADFSSSHSFNSLFHFPVWHSTFPKSFLISPHSKPPLPLTPASSVPLWSSPCLPLLIRLRPQALHLALHWPALLGTMKCYPTLVLYSPLLTIAWSLSAIWVVSD